MSNANRSRHARRVFVVRSAALAAVAGMFCAAPALAEPKGARVAKGSASVETRGSDTVIRASDRAVINYRSFDVAGGERVQFVQPSSDARVLNRIDGGAPSRIDGAIRANGRVYFVNPSGVTFGPGSSVQATGFVAAAANLSDADFLAGVDRFTGATGAVVNAGAIDVDGTLALVGGRVSNTGSLRGDVVALVAGGETYLKSGDGRLMVNVSGGAGAGTAPGVAHAGQAAAKSQFVAAAGDLYSLAVRTTGTIKSPDVSITARPSKLPAPAAGAAAVGVVDVAGGAIDASSASGKGGRVAITGDYVAVRNATIDARGATGGGTVEVGGGWQGTGALAHSEATLVAADATIRADATDRGDGGTVAVWSDGATRFAGTISARGGPRGGDGGRVETSGDVLAAGGAVDTRAPKGNVGVYLLDPTEIRINPFAPTGTFQDETGALSGTGPTFDANGNFVAPDLTGTTTFIAPGDVATQLLTNNVTISTQIHRFNPTAEQLANQDLLTAYVRDVIQPNSGSIRITAPITYTGTEPRVLTLRANAGIAITESVTATNGKLSLELRAREGYRYPLAELPSAIRGPELSEAQGPVFVDDNVFGNLIDNATGLGISRPQNQGVELGKSGGMTIDTNGGNLTASGRFVRTFFQNTSFSGADLGTINNSADIVTRGGRVDFRSSGEITVGNVDTRIASGRRAGQGGSVTMFSSQSYFPPRDANTLASIAGTPGSNAQVIFQNSGTTIDAGDATVRLRGGAVILAGDALRGGRVQLEALGYIDAAGVDIVNSDIVVRDFVGDELFAREFGFPTKLDPDAAPPTTAELREAIAIKRAGGTAPRNGNAVAADPTFRAYAIEAGSVELRGDVRANQELDLSVLATDGDLTIGRLVRNGRNNDGDIVGRTVGGAVDGNGYLTLRAPNGTVRVEEAIGALGGRADVNTAGAGSPAPYAVTVAGKSVELASVYGGGPVNITGDDAIRVIGSNPVWLSATNAFFVNRKPTFGRRTLDDGSVAPIYASTDFTLDPNRKLYEFDLRQSVTRLESQPSTFTPFQFDNPSTTEQFLSVTFSDVARTAAEEIAGATPQQTRGFEVTGGISTDVARTLSQVGVRVRDVRSDELLESLFGRGYYDDVAGGPISSRPASERVYEMDPELMRIETQVAKPRVPANAAERVVAKFNEVAMRPARDAETGKTVVGPNGLPQMESRSVEIREHLGKSVEAYLDQNPGDIDPAKLRAFIDSDPAQAESKKDVKGLQDLLRLIGQLGLAPAEERQARSTTVGLAQPERIDRPTLEKVIDPSARP